MYGIPKHIDLGFLTGKELNQICIGVGQLQLNFEEHIRLFIYNAFTYLDEQGIKHNVESAPKSAPFVVNLLRSTITKVEHQGDDAIGLTFSNGVRLILYENHNGYTCFEIWRKDHPDIVV